MKVLLTITRIIVGVLFIFSGLVKANDPQGLSYKMHEYFEAWNMAALNDYALALALVMNVFEIVAGIAILLGWRVKLFTWLLLLLIIFFTFLTGYAAFSGKIAACGCFGDCIPLKPIESFWKDVILLVLIVFLLINHQRIRPLVTPKIAVVSLALATLIVSVMQWYVLEHLPFVDCLPYKKGNDLVEQMKMPPGYIADEYAYTFKYKRDGKEFEFTQDSIPDDVDENYEFVGRGQKLIRKGNDLKPKITDFTLKTLSGTDTTQAILTQPGKYILMFAQVVLDKPQRYDQTLWREFRERNIPFFIVTADPESARLKFGPGYTVLSCDATVIKTAARANPTYFVIQGGKVLGKESYARTEEILQSLK
ncbi:MAG: DoxX family protein [Chitinophagaceae bacterium]|jgi:uncharacterized membrane protein YphA (DoxX/SURF4 family)|nr:DoxX family protein [Chitinophagaceae bacterium]